MKNIIIQSYFKHFLNLILILIIFPLGIHYISAQDVLAIKHGDTLRVTAHKLNIKKQVVTFIELQEDKLSLRGESTMMLPLVFIDRLEVVNGQRSMAIDSAIVRALEGVLVGLIFTYIPGIEIDNILIVNDCIGCYPILMMGLGAIVGFVYGAIKGSSIKTNRWKRVSLGQLQFGVVPQGESMIGLGVLFRF